MPLPVPTSEESAHDKGNMEIEGGDTSNAPKPLVFELHGSQFENRPVDRANKKFKWRNIDYL